MQGLHSVGELRESLEDRRVIGQITLEGDLAMFDYQSAQIAGSRRSRRGAGHRQLPGTQRSRAADGPRRCRSRSAILKQRIDELNQTRLKQMQQDAGGSSSRGQAGHQPAGGPPRGAEVRGLRRSARTTRAEPSWRLHEGLLRHPGRLHRRHDQGHERHGRLSTSALPRTAAPPTRNDGTEVAPGPFGRVGWLAAMSSNGSNVGYRGTHKIGKSDVDFIYQVSTSLNMAAAPGLQNTWTKSSNTVQGAIGLGDTYLGFQGKAVGQAEVRRDAACRTRPPPTD